MIRNSYLKDCAYVCLWFPKKKATGQFESKSATAYKIPHIHKSSGDNDTIEDFSDDSTNEIEVFLIPYCPKYNDPLRSTSMLNITRLLEFNVMELYKLFD